MSNTIDIAGLKIVLDQIKVYIDKRVTDSGTFTPTQANQLAALNSWYTAAVDSGDAAGTIDKWNEVKAFLAGYGETDTLANVIEGAKTAVVQSLDSSVDSTANQAIASITMTDGKLSATKITLPTVNNATLTLKAGAVSKSFTANSATNQSFEVPTMGAATASVAGTAGLVPVSKAGEQNKVLSAAGTWVNQTVNTDTKVTSAANHYTPATDSASAINRTATGNTGTPGSTVQVITGIHVSRDSKGHVTDVTIDNGATTDTTYKAFTGAKPSTTGHLGAQTEPKAGSEGLVPAPAAGDDGKFLRGDGNWATPTDSKYQLSISGHTVSIVPAGTNGAANSVTVPDNNTDTKVTSVDNHYTPSENAKSAVTANATGGSVIATNGSSVQVVTGVTVKKDAKGHVTGVSVSSVGVKDTNTDHYDKITKGNNATSGVKILSVATAGSATGSATGDYYVPNADTAQAGVVTILPTGSATDTAGTSSVYALANIFK